MFENINIRRPESKKCWYIKGCPASMYLNCQAYAKGVNCWEIKAGCLCNYGQLNFTDCQNCSIYKDYLDLNPP